MARREVKSPRPTEAPRPDPGFFDFDPEASAWVAERLRRLALGLTAALVVARAYWPCEAVSEADTGSSLTWVLALLATSGLALVALWIEGKTWLRWSWADIAFYALFLLVGLSAREAAERRIAFNLAWQWVGVAIAFFLLRTLPRTRRETAALAGVFVATAVAVAAYGLYQVGKEYPEQHRRYLAEPNRYLADRGIDPNSPARKVFEDRLLGSNEPMATFALANSLAGFLVGPAAIALAVALENALRRDGRGPKIVPLTTAALPLLLLLVCLLLTKSRSAYLGLGVALAIIAWRLSSEVPPKAIRMAGAVLAAGLALMVVLAAAAGHLDRQVLTQSTKSLRYRTEYWRGTWEVIRQENGTWLSGLGPGNFAGPYLKHKLPESSEEIKDPHNMVLDVWVTAGLPAVGLLLSALGLALRDIFARNHAGVAGLSEAEDSAESDRSAAAMPRGAAPPRQPIWLLAFAGVGGWLLAWPLGQLNPFYPDLQARWLLLGGAWAWAVACGFTLWRRLPVPAWAAGAAVAAIGVNLLAAGGIGMATVALSFWGLAALGLNLRDDRPCGRLRALDGRGTAFILAAFWAMLAGTFSGTVAPFWKAQAKIAEADELIAKRYPDIDHIQDLYHQATQLDEYEVQPWLALAQLVFRATQQEGGIPPQSVWEQIDKDLHNAAQPPRNPNSLAVQQLRSELARRMLLRENLTQTAAARIRNAHVEAAYRASALYPTNASLRADLAEAIADNGKLDAAVREARIALELDRATPHADKKLTPAVRSRLNRELKEWTTPKEEPKQPDAQAQSKPGSKDK
jgi:O-antigen ligase